MKPAYQPLIFRYAVGTVAATLLLTVGMGAQVTTTGAGMAFPDWPSSDGHNLFLYPWLSSHGDKFLEHGHRLAGSFIGLLSIGLVVLLWLREPRRWVRYLGLGVLLAVISQGVLGGQRVLLDARGLAFLHGVFASWVLGLMAAVALVTSRGWLEPQRDSHVTAGRAWWKWSALATSALIAVQYILGALVRHRGSVVYEHAGFAVLVLIAAVVSALGARQSGSAWLRRPAGLLVALAVLQIGLGLATFVVKFGFGSYVALVGSPLQVGVRTSHVLLGMLVWMVSVILSLRTLRVTSLQHPTWSSPSTLELNAAQSVTGGLR